MFSLDISEHGNGQGIRELRVATVDPRRIRLSAELTCSAWREGSDF